MSKDEKVIPTIREVLEKRGWTQAALEDKGKRVCLLGARNVSIWGAVFPDACCYSSSPNERELLEIVLDSRDERLREEVSRLYPRFNLSIHNPRAANLVAFNDHWDITLDDVLRVVDAAERAPC